MQRVSTLFKTLLYLRHKIDGISNLRYVNEAKSILDDCLKATKWKVRDVLRQLQCLVSLQGLAKSWAPSRIHLLETGKEGNISFVDRYLKKTSTATHLNSSPTLHYVKSYVVPTAIDQYSTPLREPDCKALGQDVSKFRASYVQNEAV